MDTMHLRHQAAAPLAKWLVACLVTAAGGTACAQDMAAASVEAMAMVPRFEMTGQPLARLDGPTDGSARIEAAGWAARGGSAFGVAVGSSLDRMAALPGQVPQMHSSLDVGLRWRSAVGARQRVDVAAWRELSGDPEDGKGVKTRVEMQFSDARSKGFAELGAVGMQLSSDSRLSMKIRKGKPMLYYRSKF